MKELQGKASDILSDIELYEAETKTSFLPSEEVKYYLEIIFSD
jgi:hypothetical protein